MFPLFRRYFRMCLLVRLVGLLSFELPGSKEIVKERPTCKDVEKLKASELRFAVHCAFEQLFLLLFKLSQSGASLCRFMIKYLDLTSFDTVFSYAHTIFQVCTKILKLTSPTPPQPQKRYT